MRKSAPVFQARYYTGRKRTCDEGHVGRIGAFTRLCGACLEAHWALGGWTGELPEAPTGPRLVAGEAAEPPSVERDGLYVLVCGSREWQDRLSIWEELASRNVDTVIHGAARGADTLAGDVARELGLPVQEFPADWDRFGKGAGYVRNSQMVKEQPDLVLAFGEGKGTEHTVKLAEKAGIPVVRVTDRLTQRA